MFAGCRIKAVCKQFQIILVFFRPSEVFINNPIPIILQVPEIARAAVKKCSSKELPQKRKAEREMHPSQPSFYLICISWAGQLCSRSPDQSQSGRWHSQNRQPLGCPGAVPGPERRSKKRLPVLQNLSGSLTSPASSGHWQILHHWLLQIFLKDPKLLISSFLLL